MNPALLAIDPAVAAATVQVDTASLSVVELADLQPLLAEVDRAGIDRQSLFLGLTLLSDDFNASGCMVSHLDAITIVRRALRLLADPDQLLGLQLGRESRLTDCGVLGLGMLAAPTLDHAVTLALRYARSAGYLVDLQLQRSMGRITWIAEHLPDSRGLSPFLVDMTFASIVQMCRRIADANFAPITVELTRARPADARAYEDFFRCPVHFGFPRNGLVADRGWFDLPLPMANTMSYRLSCDLLEGGGHRNRPFRHRRPQAGIHALDWWHTPRCAGRPWASGCRGRPPRAPARSSWRGGEHPTRYRSPLARHPSKLATSAIKLAAKAVHGGAGDRTGFERACA
jgi:Arabinose-binding domain of AraC transcription regulator, N-term